MMNLDKGDSLAVASVWSNQITVPSLYNTLCFNMILDYSAVMFWLPNFFYHGILQQIYT